MRVARSKRTAQTFAVIGLMTAILLAGLQAEPTPAMGDEAPVRLPTVKASAQKNPLDVLQRLAAKGDAAACFELGSRYLNGEGVPEDTERGVALLEQSARNGGGKAAFRLGKMYHDGTGVTQDFARSFEFYTLAARAGEMEAQHNIGAMLLSARGVKRDFTEGLAWLVLARQSGAESDAEDQARAYLRKINRPEIIVEAEKRAEELADILKQTPATLTPKAVITGKAVLPPPSQKVEPPPVAEPVKKVPIKL